MLSKSVYRAIVPFTLAVAALVAIQGRVQSSDPSSSSLGLPFQGMDNIASSTDKTEQHQRRLAALQGLRGLQTETETEARQCLPPRPPPPLPGKRGIGYALREEGKVGSWVENLPKMIGLKPYWNYSWSPKRIPQQPDDIEFVPMLWGAWGEKGLIKTIVNEIYPQIEAGQAKRVLGFNEPDLAVQSNLPVSDATKYWHILEDIGVPLASPSVAKGLGSWMGNFMKETEENCLRMEYVALHWYGGANFASFEKHMTEVYETYGSKRPLLLTEFAPADWAAKTVNDNRFSQERVLEFMKEALPWLESQDWIAGYAWFPFSPLRSEGASSALYDINGDQTALGRYYSTVTTDNPSGDQTIQVGRQDADDNNRDAEKQSKDRTRSKDSP